MKQSIEQVLDGFTALDIYLTYTENKSNYGRTNIDQLPKHLFKLIIFDFGKEFSNWKNISNHHDIDIYFADPGTPSQRALNEHSSSEWIA